jgi:hypothetical protein
MPRGCVPRSSCGHSGFARCWPACFVARCRSPGYWSPRTTRSESTPDWHRAGASSRSLSRSSVVSPHWCCWPAVVRRSASRRGDRGCRIARRVGGRAATIPAAGADAGRGCRGLLHPAGLSGCCRGGRTDSFPEPRVPFRLSLTGRFDQQSVDHTAVDPILETRPRGPIRPTQIAVASLLIGFVLLIIANSGIAHLFGVLVLAVAALAAYRAVDPSWLAGQLCRMSSCRPEN